MHFVQPSDSYITSKYDEIIMKMPKPALVIRSLMNGYKNLSTTTTIGYLITFVLRRVLFGEKYLGSEAQTNSI